MPQPADLPVIDERVAEAKQRGADYVTFAGYQNSLAPPLSTPTRRFATSWLRSAPASTSHRFTAPNRLPQL